LRSSSKSSFGPAAALVALLVAGPCGQAFAQEQDPIGAILDQPPAAPPPAAAAPTPAVTTPAPFPYAPPPPAYGAPPAAIYSPPPAPSRARLTAPVLIDELGKSPEAPPTPTDLNYESRMRSSFASAQGLQGPLDGSWSLRGEGGAELYSLQVVDRGQGALEGAWRDPRRRGSPEASGFLADIRRDGAQLSVNFYPRAGAGLVSIQLNAAIDGIWTGDLTEGGARRPVTMRRD
jgi:hypothetical protein